MVSLSTWLEVKPKSSLLTLTCRAIGHRQTNEIRIALRDNELHISKEQTRKEIGTGNYIQEKGSYLISSLGIMVNPQMINKSVDANDGSTLTLILLNKGDSK